MCGIYSYDKCLRCGRGNILYISEQEHDYEGIYSICCDEEDWKEQAKLARQIANLPERENV